MRLCVLVAASNSYVADVRLYGHKARAVVSAFEERIWKHFRARAFFLSCGTACIYYGGTKNCCRSPKRS